jgi:hypothetical protein
MIKILFPLLVLALSNWAFAADASRLTKNSGTQKPIQLETQR